MSEKYNTDERIPDSRKFPHFHHYYKENFKLPLIEDLKMSPDMAKKEFMKSRDGILTLSVYNPYDTPMFHYFHLYNINKPLFIILTGASQVMGSFMYQEEDFFTNP